MEENLYNLTRICVEKTLSDVYSEEIEEMEINYLPGVVFEKNKINQSIPNHFIKEQIEGTYVNGVFTPLKGIEYKVPYINETIENFRGTSRVGTSEYGLSIPIGSGKELSMDVGSGKELSMDVGSGKELSVNPGIETTNINMPNENLNSQNFEININGYGDLLISGLYKDQKRHIHEMHVYLFNKYGNDMCIEILSGPLMLGGLTENILETKYIDNVGTIYGAKDMLNDVADNILNGYSVVNYDFKGSGIGTVVMSKEGSPNLVQSYEFGIENPKTDALRSTFRANESLYYPADTNVLTKSSQSLATDEPIGNAVSLDKPKPKPPTSDPLQIIDVVSSIPTINISSGNVVQVENQPYNIDKTLSSEQQDLYTQKFEKIFSIISKEEEEEEEKKKEEKNVKYENFSYPKKSLFRRIKNFKDKGIIKINPKLGLVNSIIKRQFSVKKITISFSGDGKKVKRTSIRELESSLDEKGNIIKVDPIEYKIQNLSPIESIKTVLRERIFPLVNIDFEFLDGKIENELNFNESGVVRIGFDEKSGCWSTVGLETFFSMEKTTMNFAWLDAATIMHEFCHILGLVHEHQNPIGASIEWDEEVLYKWANVVHGWDEITTYNNIIKKYSVDSINGIKYDPNSIMHYFFPAYLTKNKKGSKQNLQLAIEDIKFLISVFPGKNINYKEFYKKIYGKNIEEDSNWFSNSVKLLIVAIILSLIYFLYKRNKSIKKN